MAANTQFSFDLPVINTSVTGESFLSPTPESTTPETINQIFANQQTEIANSDAAFAQAQLNEQQRIAERDAKLENNRRNRRRSATEQITDFAASAGIKGAINVGSALYGVADLFSRGAAGGDKFERQIDQDLHTKLGLDKPDYNVSTKASLDRLSDDLLDIVGVQGSLSQNMQKAREIVDTEMLSDPLQFSKERVAQLNKERQAGTQTRVEALIEQGHTEFMAKVKDELGSAGAAVEALVDNPTAAVDMALESLPNMFLAGGIGKAAVDDVLKRVSPKNAQKFINSKQGKAIVDRVSARAGLASVAITEGMSNGVSARAGILNMSHDDLMSGSPMYKELIDGGVSPEAAKNQIADKVFDVTAAISAGTGAVASKISGTDKFLGSLFTPKSKVANLVTSSVKGAVSEGVEETIQGASGQLAENIAVKEYANKDQDILQGVGEATGSGLVVGSLSGGTTAAAGNVTDAAKEIAKPVETATKKAVEKTKAVVEAAQESKQVQEAVQDEETAAQLRDTTNPEYDPVVAFDVASHKKTLPSDSEGLVERKAELQTHVENIGKKAIQAYQDVPQDENADNFVEKSEAASNLMAQYEDAKARLNTLKAADIVTEQSAETIIPKAVDGDVAAKDKLLGSVPNLSTDQLNTLVQSDTVTADEKVRIKSHLETRKALEAVGAIEISPTMAKVHDDVINGSEGKRGVLDYQSAINTYVDAGNTEAASAQLDQMLAFSANHKKKVLAVKKAFDAHVKAPNSAQALKLSEKVEADYGLKIHKGSNNSGLITRMLKEVDALQRAFTESRHVIKLANAPKADVQAVQPQVDTAPVQEAVEQSAPVDTETQKTESELSSKPVIATTGLIKEHFKVTGKKLLQTVPSVFTKVLPNTTYNQEQLTEEQNNALPAVMRFEKKFSSLLNKVVKPANKGYEHRDFYNYLLDDSGKLSDNTASAISLTVMDWLGTQASNTISNNQEAINLILGRDKDDLISQDIQGILANVGVSRTNLAESLGAKIVKSLGLSEVGKVPGDYKAKLELSVGQLAIHAMLSGKLLTSTNLQNSVLDVHRPADAQSTDPKAYTSYVRVATTFNKELGRDVPAKAVEQLISNLRGSDGLLDSLFGIETHVTKPSLTKPSAKSVPKQIKGSINAVPKKMQDVIAKHQARPMKNKQNVTNAFMFLTDEQREVIAGANHDYESNTHVSQWESVKAVNADIARGIQNFVEHTEAVADQEFYFTHFVSKQMRLFMNSNTVNPQTNKIHRHLMGYTNDEVQIDPSNKQQMEQFFTAVAEGLGVGVDKLLTNDSLLELADVMKKDAIMAGVDAIVALNSGTYDVDKTAELQQQIVDAVKAGGEKIFSLDSLVALADYRMAGEGKPFTTNIFREVDGVTNGVIIGLFQLAAAGDYDGLVKKLERGGLFFDGTQNLAEWAKNPINNDTYEDLAEAWVSVLAEFDTLLESGTMPTGKGSKKIAESVGILRAINADASQDVRTTIRSLVGEIARKTAKSPVMVTSYGSSIIKVRASFVDSVLDSLYSKIVKMANENDQAGLDTVSAELSDLLNYKVEITVDNAIKFTLPKDMRHKLLTAVDAYYGTALEQSLKSTFAEFMDNRTALNEALQINFHAFNVVYQRLLREEEEKLGHKVSRDVQLKLVKQVQELVPAFRSPMSDGINDSIVVMKEEKVRTTDRESQVESKFANRVAGTNIRLEGNEVVTEAITSRVAKRDAEGKVIKKGQKGYGFDIVEGRNTTTSNISERQFQDGGVSGVILGIHSMDAATMYGLLENYTALNVHDAAAFNLNEVMEGSQAINESFYNVIKNYNMREEIYASLERAINVLKSGKNGKADMFAFEQAVGENLEAFNTDVYMSKFREETETQNALRQEILDNLQTVQQYNPGEGGQYQVLNNQDTSALKGSAETKYAKQVANDALKSAQRNIDPDNFGASTVTQINSATSQQVFSSLASVGNVKDSATHTNHLSNILDNLVNKVVEPVQVAIRNSGNETYGATRGNEVFLNVGMGTLANGTQMSAQEVYVHELVHNVTRTGVTGTSWAKRDLQKLYLDARKVVKAEDFLNRNSNGDILDFQGNVITAQSAGYARELAAATERYDYIFNNTDGNHLHEFVALGLTNEAFNKKLSTITGVTKKDKLWQGDVASSLMHLFQVIADWVTSRVTHTSNITADQKLMKLAEQLAGIDARKKQTILFNSDKVTEHIHAGIAKFVAEPIHKLASSSVVRNSRSKIVRNVGNIVSKIPYTTIEAYSQVMSDVSRRMGITKDSLIHSLITEGIGNTKFNHKFHELLRYSNKMIDQARTHIKTNVIKELTGAFHTEYGSSTRKALTNVVLKTDLHTLVGAYGWNKVRQFFDDKANVEQEINALELELDKQFKAKGRNHYFKKHAESLGSYMANGVFTQEHTATNADAIAREFGTDNEPVQNYKDAAAIIDKLASLYAVKYTNGQQLALVKKLADAEFKADKVNNGLTFLAQVHADSVKRSQELLFKGNPSSVIKGYTKEIINPNTTVIVAPLSEEATLLREGYQRESQPLERDAMDTTSEEMYRYISKDNLLTTYEAGIASTTNKKAKGTDLIDVYVQQDSSNPQAEAISAGFQIHAKKLQATKKQYTAADTKLKGAALAPIFNEDGNVTQYRYLMSERNKVEVLEKDGNFDTIMGAMEASISDKLNTEDINKRLIQLAKDTFDEKYAENPKNFVTVGKNGSTERYREIYAMLPYEARQEIKRVWGSDNMQVPAELVTLMFGQRKISGAQKLLETAAFDKLNVRVLEMLGINLGKKIKTIENVWQEIVKITKDVIVIKSGVVLLGNVLSNLAILKVAGISFRDIIKNHGVAITYAKQYQKKTAELEALKRELRVNPNATNVKGKQVKIAMLETELNENPVKELIDEGVYQSIVEDVDVEDDQFTYKSKLQEWITPKFVSDGKVPQLLTDIGQNLIISHETTLYKALRDATQLSDFVARYTLHQANLENGMTNKESIQDIVDTFVNYDLPTHKGIQYANDMGLVMFTKFFIRIQKVIARMATKKTANFVGLALLQYGLDVDIEDIMDAMVSPDTVTNKFHNPYDVFKNMLDVPLTNLVGAGL